ncbi:hypothetical protein AB0B31_35385 [Catellatospora citrea]|uniref:hypothetical protein n=1 Tax=Catellatospora citrea TaxID=53366 RepID=UPI0033E143CF
MQSMDPVKVYGLAQVLAQVAQDRQVVVFTHDDRLPAAVRHLQLDARILAVSRLARSRVTVSGDKHTNPAMRYLDDAWAIARDEDMADDVRVPLVGNLIRDAIEYACHELIRTRGFKAGTPITDLEAEISEAQIRGVRPLLALALLSDATRVGELPDVLRRLHPPAARVVAIANSSAHGNTGIDLTALVQDAQRVVGKLGQP